MAVCRFKIIATPVDRSASSAARKINKTFAFLLSLLSTFFINMVGVVQLTVFVANSAVLIYYGRKWFKLRSMFNKIEKAEEISVTETDLKKYIGSYVCLTGSIRKLSDFPMLPSSYSEAANAVVQSIQKV